MAGTLSPKGTAAGSLVASSNECSAIVRPVESRERSHRHGPQEPRAGQRAGERTEAAVSSKALLEWEGQGERRACQQRCRLARAKGHVRARAALAERLREPYQGEATVRAPGARIAPIRRRGAPPVSSLRVISACGLFSWQYVQRSFLCPVLCVSPSSPPQRTQKFYLPFLRNIFPRKEIIRCHDAVTIVCWNTGMAGR